jgi:class 3 adenylate cyclase
MDEGRKWTATVMFCDLVGSTAQRTALGDDAADRLAATLDVLLRQDVDDHDGTVVKSTGDGLMAVFDSTSDALNAAVEAHQAAELHNRRAADSEQLVLRVGLSAGDVHLVANDCHGTAVVEAARLESVAEPGTILVAAIVRVLAGSRGGHRFDPVGTLTLKGLEPIEAFRVHWDPPSLAASMPLPWRMDLSPSSGVVAREASRETLLEAARLADESGERRVVFVAGEAGIGKTTLVGDVARALYADGTTVLYGACDEDVVVPYRPFVELLRYFALHAPDAWLQRLDPASLSQVARLAPEVADRCPGLPAVPVSDPDAERYLLFNAISSVLSATSEIEPLMLVLDDLHWADRPTLNLFRHLASVPLGRVLIVATYRDVELTATHALTGVLGAMTREPDVLRLSLKGFDHDEIAAFLEASAGHELGVEGREFAVVLWQETDGNPFFVSEVVRDLIETGRLVQDDRGYWRSTVSLNETGIPDTIRAVVRARASRLDEGDTTALSAASVVGRNFDLATLTATTGRPAAELLDVLEHAQTLALVSEVPDVPGGFRFRHSLVHQAFYRDIGTTRRLMLHAQIADVIDAGARDGVDDGARAIQVAEHLLAAGDLADAGRRRDAYRRAGEHTLAMLAPDEAVRWFGHALDAGDGADGEERCSLLLALGVAQRDAGSTEYGGTLRAAGELARTVGSPELMARAALENFRGFWSTSGSVDADRIEELASARAALGDVDRPIAARVLATTAVELLYSDDEASRLGLADEALAMGRRVDEKATLAYLLRSWDLVHRLPWFLDERHDANHEHLAISGALGDPVERFWALNNASILALERGDTRRFEEVAPQVLPAARGTGQKLLEWIGGFISVSRHIIRCEWQLAEALMERTHQLGVECGQPDAGEVYASHLFEIRRAQGRSDELVDLLRAVIDAAPEIEAFRPALGVCYVDLDCPDGRDLFEADVADRFARYRPNGMWLTSMMMNAEVASFFENLEAADFLLDVLSPWRDQVAWTGTTSGGAVALAVGDLETQLGNFKEAEYDLGRALDLHRGFGAGAWVGRTLVATARLYLTRRASGDPEAARVALAEAAELAGSLGSGVLQRKAADLATRL